MFVVVRPLAVAAATFGERIGARQRVMISWFGIRGIGSVFYLVYVIGHGVAESLARPLITFTLVTVATSILVHGVTAQPLVEQYRRYRAIRGQSR